MSHSDEAIDAFEAAALEDRPDTNDWDGETVDRMQISVAYGEVCRLEADLVSLLDRVKYYGEPIHRERLEELVGELRTLKKVLE